MPRIDRPRTSRTQSRFRTWRLRAVQLALALAGTGLVAAISVAAIGDNTGLTPERALQRTLVRQRVAAGLPATPTPPTGTQPGGTAPDSQHGAQPAVTREQILEAVDSLEAEIKMTFAEVEKLKAEAYSAKDLIRMNYITGKLQEMQQVADIVMPVIASIRQPGQDLFVMQAKLSTIRQGAEQIRRAAGDARKVDSDTLDATSAGFDSVNGENNTPGASIDDPTLPPNPTTIDVVGERPGNVSPYK